MASDKVKAADVALVEAGQHVFLPRREGGSYQLMKIGSVYRLRPMGVHGILGAWETSPEGEATETPPVTPQ